MSSKISKLAVLVGAILFFVGLFLPWWEISLALPERGASMADVAKMDTAIKQIDEYMKNNVKWYESHGVDRLVRKNTKSDGRASCTLMGSDIGTGIAAFVFSFLLATLALLPQFVEPTRPFAWVGALLCAATSVLIFILSLVWISESPAKNFEPLLVQGIRIGPILSLVASIAVFAGGLLSVRAAYQDRPDVKLDPRVAAIWSSLRDRSCFSRDRSCFSRGSVCLSMAQPQSRGPFG